MEVVTVLIRRALPIVHVVIRRSISFGKMNQIPLWPVRTHYPCLLQSIFMCKSLQFGLDVLQNSVFRSFLRLVRTSGFFFIFELIIFFILVPRPVWTFVSIILTSLWRIFAMQLQPCQLLLKHFLLLLS